MNASRPDDQRTAVVRHAQRASGQVGALASMIAGTDPFPEIAQQLLAARGSLDSLLVRLVELELGDRLPSQQMRDDVDGLLRTALGRSTHDRRSPRARRSLRAVSMRLPQHDEGTR